MEQRMLFPNLSLISFVGVDEKTDLKKIKDFPSTLPIEWSVLFSDTKSKTVDARYPSYDFCKDFLNFAHENSLHGSLHLCGSVIERFLNQEQDVLDLAQRATRIQLNINIKDYPDHNKLTDRIFHMTDVYNYTIILQQNKTKAKFMDSVLARPSKKIHVLHDGSGGFGREITQVVAPETEHFTGYAGGIKPENVAKIARLIEDVNPNNLPYYLDMESGIRDNNLLSLEKCVQIRYNLDIEGYSEV